jgi:hypothetical protein
MNLTTEQEARVTFNVNAFGDALAQDHNDHRMHEWFVVIRREMVEETVPLGHPELRNQLDWIDRILDSIEARRKSTVGHIAANMRSMFVLETAGHYLN